MAFNDCGANIGLVITTVKNKTRGPPTKVHRFCDLVAKLLKLEASFNNGIDEVVPQIPNILNPNILFYHIVCGHYSTTFKGLQLKIKKRLEPDGAAHYNTTDSTVIRQVCPKKRAMASRNKISKVAPGLSQSKKPMQILHP